jgi:hypothetical protein
MHRCSIVPVVAVVAVVAVTLVLAGATPAGGTEVRPGQLVTVPLSGSTVLTDGCSTDRTVSNVVVRPDSAARLAGGLPDPWAIGRGNAVTTLRISRRAVVGSFIVVTWTAAANTCFRLFGSATLAVVSPQRCVLPLPFRRECPSTKSMPNRATTPTPVSHGPARS